MELDFLKDLSPQTAFVVGLAWLLREVMRARGGASAPCEEIAEALKEVSKHISVNTDLVKGFIMKMESFASSLNRVEVDLDKMRDEVRNRP